MASDEHEREKQKDLNSMRSEISALQVRLDFSEKAREKLEAKVAKIENEVTSYIIRFSIGTIVVLVSTLGFVMRHILLK